jgi:hypothetical protein
MADIFAPSDHRTARRIVDRQPARRRGVREPAAENNDVVSTG